MKTKKSTLLSLATAAAIVATTFGTYAAWDTMSVTSNAQAVTIAAPVNMEITPAEFTLANRDLGESLPKYTSTTKVKVENVPDSEESNYTLKVSANAYTDAAKETPVTDQVKVSATTTSESATNGEHDITVTVTPKEDENNPGNYAGDYYVTVTAEIVPKA